MNVFQRFLTVKSWENTSLPATAGYSNVSINKSVMFARSSSAKNKRGKLNPTINEKYNIIRGHSSYISHFEIVSK